MIPIYLRVTIDGNGWRSRQIDSFSPINGPITLVDFSLFSSRIYKEGSALVDLRWPSPLTGQVSRRLNASIRSCSGTSISSGDRASNRIRGTPSFRCAQAVARRKSFRNRSNRSIMDVTLLPGYYGSNNEGGCVEVQHALKV